ncbi:MAG: cytochrome C biogenesis protein CcsA [Pseudomonadota bacterium]|nr:cytochrome C biogenesis protein CcsA [Pseudomonadota bacterium]
MKKKLWLSIGLLITAFSLQANAATYLNQTDADKLSAYINNNSLACMSCHAINQKIVGPAFIDISRRYKRDPKSLSSLTFHIANGSTGVWGPINMPSNMATEAQAKILSGLILNLTKK